MIIENIIGSSGGLEDGDILLQIGLCKAVAADLSPIAIGHRQRVALVLHLSLDEYADSVASAAVDGLF